MFSINKLSLFLCCLLSVRDSHHQQIQNSICAQRVESSENNQFVCRQVCDNRPEEGDYYDFRIVNDGECYRKCNITKAASENNHARQKMETKRAETPSSDVTESSTMGSFVEETSTWTSTTQTGTSSETVSVPVSMLSVPNNSNNETDNSKIIREPLLTEIRTVESTQQHTTETDISGTKQAMSTDSPDTRLPFTSLTKVSPTLNTTESSKSMTKNVSIGSSTRFNAHTTETTETNIATSLGDTESKKIIFDSRENSDLVTSEDSVTTFYPSPVSTNLDPQPTRETATGQPTTQTFIPTGTQVYSVKLPTSDELITSEKDATEAVTSTVFPSYETQTLPVVTSAATLQPATTTTAEEEIISAPFTTLSIPNESNYKAEEGVTVRESSTGKTTKDTDEDKDKDKLQLTEISTVAHIRSTRPLFPTTETAVSTTTPSVDLKSETITTEDSPTELTTLPKYSSPVRKLTSRVSSASTVPPTESSNQVYSTDETRLTEQASVKITTTTTVSSNPSKGHHMLHPVLLTANTVPKLQPTPFSFTEKATSLETLPEVTETALELMKLLTLTHVESTTNTSAVTLTELETQKDMRAETSLKLLELTTSSGGTANMTPVSLSEADETETQITQTTLGDKLMQTIAFTTDQTVAAVTKIPTTEKPSTSFLSRQEILSTKTSQPPTERVPTTSEKIATHRHLSELAKTTQSEFTSHGAEQGFKTESIISTVGSTTEPLVATVLLFAPTESEIPTTEQPDKTTLSINTTENRLSTVAGVSLSVTSQQTPMNTNLLRQEIETTSKTESTKLAESIVETTSPIVATEPKTLGDRYIESVSLTDTIENQQATTPVFSTTTPSQTETNYISKTKELTTAHNQSSIIPVMSTTVQTLPKIQTNYAYKARKLTTINDKQSSTIPVLITTVQTPSKIQTKYINNTETTKPIIMNVSEPQTTTTELPIVETFVDEAPAREKSSQTSTYTTTLRQTDGTTPMYTVLLWTKANRELIPVTDSTETSVTSHLTLPTVHSIETSDTTLPNMLPLTNTPHETDSPAVHPTSTIPSSLTQPAVTVTTLPNMLPLTNTPHETDSPAVHPTSTIPSSLTQPAVTVTTKSPFRSGLLPALMRSVIARIITKPNDYSRPLHSLVRPLIIKLFTKSPEPTTVCRKLSTTSTAQTPTDTTVTTTESFVPTTALSVDPITVTVTSADSSTVPVVPTKPPGIVSIISQLHHCAKYPCIRPQNRHPHSQLARLHQHQNKVTPVVTIIHHPGDRKLNNCHRLSGAHGLEHCISQPDPESNKYVHLIPSNEDNNILINNHRQQDALQRLKLLHEPRRHQNISDTLQENVTDKINLNHNDSNQNDKLSQIYKSIPLHALHPQRPQIPEKEPQQPQKALHNMNCSQQLNDSNYNDKSPQSQQSTPLHKLQPQRSKYYKDNEDPPQHVLHRLIHHSHKPELHKVDRPHQHRASEFTNRLHNLHRLDRLHQNVPLSSRSHNVHRPTPDHRLNRFPQRQRQNPQSFPNSSRRQMNPFQRQNLQNFRKQYLYTS